MGYSWHFSFFILRFVEFVFACIIFSIIFWTTKHWLEGTVKKKKKR